METAIQQSSHRCAVCNRAVIILGGEIIRACLHDDAGVIAEMQAVAYGRSHFSNHASHDNPSPL